MSMQTIIRDTAPSAQPLDPGVLDGPDPDDVIEVVPETFCLACQAKMAPFESRRRHRAWHTS